MITQKFKGDPVELKMEAAGEAAMTVVGIGLDQFFEEGYNSAPFLLSLYDQDRMPFKDRVPRDSFVDFIREAITRFPFTGSFESYIFILQQIFGEGSGVLFDVPTPGKLEMLVNASSSLEFNLVVRQIESGASVEYNLADSGGADLMARGISGIDSEYELSLLLAELIPGGITPDVTLAFFALYNFIDSADNAIVDHDGNQIVFLET